MKKTIAKILILLLSVVFLLSSAWAEAKQPKQPFLPYYWVSGQLAFPQDKGAGLSLENRIVRLSKEGFTNKLFTYTDSQGKFMLNVYELAYYYDVPVGLSDSFQVAVEQKDNWGKDAFTVTLDSTKGFKETAAIILEEGKGPPAEKVRIDLTLFLEGFYNPETKTQVPTSVQVEARSAVGADKPFNATQVQDTVVIDLAANSSGTGYFENLANGDYYLAVKHKLPNLPAGANHLPVITSGKITLNNGEIVALNFNSVETYTPEGKPESLFTKGTIKMMRGANAEGENVNGKINRINPHDFIVIQNNWLKSSPDPRADFNGDGKVNPADFVILQNEWLKEGYVPIEE